MRRVLAVGAVLVIGLVLALAYRIRAQQEAANGPPGGAGIVEGTEFDVSARIAGRITSIAAAEGAEVQAGQELVVLDCLQERARLAEAEARVQASIAQAAAARAQIETTGRSRSAASAAALAAEAQVAAARAAQESAAREAARVQSLGSYASGQSRDLSATQAQSAGHQVEAAQAQSRASRAQLSVLRAQIATAEANAQAAESAIAAAQALRDLARIAVEECTIRAPHAGVVEEVYYEVGELASPGAVLLRVVDLDEVRATFYLPNNELGEARTGRPAELRADAWPEQAFPGEVATVAAEAEFTPRNIQTRSDRDRLVYAIEIRVRNPERRLRPGMPVQVTLLPDERPARAEAR